MFSPEPIHECQLVVYSCIDIDPRPNAMKRKPCQTLLEEFSRPMGAVARNQERRDPGSPRPIMALADNRRRLLARLSTSGTPHESGDSSDHE